MRSEFDLRDAPTPNLELLDDEPLSVCERGWGEYIDDEEQELLESVADAIGYTLSGLGIEGVWRVDQDDDARLCCPQFWADMGEIEYPIVSDDGRRLKVVLKIAYIQDHNGHTVTKQAAL
jgi:hypothetical protein